MEDSFPEAILLYIFSFLSKRELCIMAQVSSKWRRIAYDKSLWKSLDSRLLWTSTVSDKAILELLRTRLASTQSLTLHGCNVTPKVAKELAHKCHNLKSLEVRATDDECVKFEEDIRVFPTRIQLLDLRSACGDFSFMRRLPRHFMEIQYISIGLHSSKSLVPDVITKMKRLKVLDMSDCGVLTDNAILRISRSCPHLESICLNQCRNLTGKTLPKVFSNCLLLHTLLLRFCKITDENIMAVEWGNSRVRELDLTGCYYLTTTGVTNVLSQLPAIEFFKMNQCGFRHILNLRVYAEIQPSFAYPYLSTLDLRWNFLLSAECLEELLKQCPSLHYLGVSHSPRIPPFVLGNMLKYTPKLKILEFGPLKKESLSESNLVANLIYYCPVLEAVSLINFRIKSPNDLQLLDSLSLKCRHLKNVKLCNPKIEHVTMGSTGRTVTVERLLIRMESLLPSPHWTFENVAHRMRSGKGTVCLREDDF